MGEFYKTFKEELIPILKLFEKWKKGTLPNLFCEASIILIAKPDEDSIRNKIIINISDEDRYKNHQKHTTKKSNSTLKESYGIIKWD